MVSQQQEHLTVAGAYYIDFTVPWQLLAGIV